jgi:hypothetical protein
MGVSRLLHDGTHHAAPDVVPVTSSPRSIAAIAACAAALAVVTSSAGARAQAREDPIGGASRGKESPQNFAAELRFGAFKPDVDSDPNLKGMTPYKDLFGSNPRVMASLEVDWQFLRVPHFGTIGVGGAFGYTKMSADAPFTDPNLGTSGEKTSLELFPFYAVGVVRADVVWRDLHVPLVPYGKLGLGYTLWRASNTLGTSNYNGVSGEGSALGLQYALGVALNLNPFDTYAAKTFDDSLGVNNSYLFAEWTRADLEGLGVQHNVLRVGGTSWTFGAAFEF